MGRNYDRVNRFVQHAIDIANNDAHGYSQYYRWGDDFDCSSLMYECAYYAGYDVSHEDPRYTGSMIADFTAAGYTCLDFDGNLSDLDPGDILLAHNANWQHTAVYVGGGQVAEASADEYGGVEGYNPGDQTGWEIHVGPVYGGWDWVLVPPADYDEEPAPAPAPSGKSRLCGIDISSWQEGIVPSQTYADFVIVKATGGTSYTNPFWRQWADDVLASGKCLGLYHYACEYDTEPGGAAEAEFFWSQVSDYAGRFVPILDWENHAIQMPVGYAKDFLDRIAELSGATPFFYGYASNVNSTDYSSIAHYPLWMASYLDRYIGSDFIDDPDSIWDTGAWNGMLMYQYTSQGDIDGWNGNIDLNVFYGGVSDWQALCGGASPQPTPTPVGDNIRYRASTDPNGYSWLPDMIGRYDTGGSSDSFAGELGDPLRWLAIEGVGPYRVCTEASGWLPWVDAFNPGDLEYGCAGDGSPILALEIPSQYVRYALHDMGGGWLPDMIGNRDTGGSADSYAGSMSIADAVRIEWA